MRVLPTRIHAILDYAVGVLLIVAPWLLGFSLGGAETWVPLILGAGLIVYSLLTDYEFSLIRSIPMNVHLTLDAVGGALLLLSPWLFGFFDWVWGPHVVVGVLEIVASLVTQTVPSDVPAYRN